jgi:hypothetical protein
MGVQNKPSERWKQAFTRGPQSNRDGHRNSESKRAGDNSTRVLRLPSEKSRSGFQNSSQSENGRTTL